MLLPALDSWQSGGATDKGQSAAGAKPNTLDWVFAQYRGDRRLAKLDDKTKRTHELGFRLVGGYTLKDGSQAGRASLSAITTAITDAVYEKLILVAATDADGNPVEHKRRTTINHAMKSCRRAWNVCRAVPIRVRLQLTESIRPAGPLLTSEQERRRQRPIRNCRRSAPKQSRVGFLAGDRKP